MDGWSRVTPAPLCFQYCRFAATDFFLFWVVITEEIDSSSIIPRCKRGVFCFCEDWFEEIQALGLTPVIAHPERNPMVQFQANRLAEWVANGVLLQLTGGSLIGRFGKSAESFAKDLLDKDLVHLVASDAHGIRARTPAMQRAHGFLCQRYGGATAERLCVENPGAIFAGSPLPARKGQNSRTPANEKQGFFDRLLSVCTGG